MQLGLALQNYESSHEAFPPGVVNDTGPVLDQPKGYHYGWMVRILPYCEMRNIYNHFNLSLGLYEAQNLSRPGRPWSGATSALRITGSIARRMTWR